MLTFASAFGNSLSYVSPDGGTVASESLPFDGTLDTSEREIAVFSDKECDHDCRYWRPNATSHCTTTCCTIDLVLTCCRWLDRLVQGLLYRVPNGSLPESRL